MHQNLLKIGMIIMIMALVCNVNALKPNEKSPISGIYRGTFSQEGKKNPAAMAVLNNFGFMSAEGFHFSGLVITDSAENTEGKVLVNGRTKRSCFNQTMACDQEKCDCNNHQRSYFEETLEKCLYKLEKTSERKRLQFVCGTKGSEKKDYPSSFNVTAARAHIDVETRPGNDVPKEMEGSYLGTMVQERDGKVETEDNIMYMNSQYLVIVKQERGKYHNYETLHCIPKFHSGNKLDCIDFVQEGQLNPANKSMLYEFDNKTQTLKVAFNSKDGGRPTQFKVDNATGIFKASQQFHNGISYGDSISTWKSQSKDPITGLMRPQTLLVDDNRVTFIQQFNIFEGLYTVDPSDPSSGLLTSLGMSGSRSGDDRPFTRFALERSVGRYMIENNLFYLAQNRLDRSSPPTSIDFSDPTQDIQIFRRDGKEPTLMIIQNVVPSAGKAGTRIRLKVTLKKQQRRAFGECPTTIKVFVGHSECSNVECDLEKFVMRCVIGDSKLVGPVPVSYVLEGIRYKTDHVFQMLPSNDKVNPGRVGGILPKIGSVGGNDNVFIPLLYPTKLDSAHFNVTIGDFPCKDLSVHKDTMLQCRTPVFPSPGQYLVKVSSKDGMAFSNVYFTARHQDGVLRLSKPRPNKGPQEGKTTVKFTIFVKEGDGKVPDDLAVSIFFGDQPAASIGNVQATSDSKIYTVTAVTPSFSELGHTKVKLTAVTQGQAYVAFSSFQVVSSKREENVRIVSVSPALLNVTGGLITIKALVPRSYVAVDKKSGRSFFALHEDTEVPLSINVGSNFCPVIEKPSLLCHEDTTKPCVGKVSCMAPPSLPGSHRVVLSFPGGSSIGTVWMTYHSNDAPKISSITPSTSKIAEKQTYTIKGSNFALKQARSIAEACDASIQVALGGEPCESVTCTSTNEVKATCNPPITSGSSSFVVSVGGASSPSDPSVDGAGNLPITSDNQPTITSVSPSKGAVTGGTTLTIQGTKFGSDASLVSVSIGGVPCSSLSLVSSSKLTCVTSGGVVGDAPISISVDNEASSLYENYAFEGEVSCENCKEVDLSKPDSDSDDDSSSGSILSTSLLLLLTMSSFLFVF